MTFADSTICAGWTNRPLTWSSDRRAPSTLDAARASPGEAGRKAERSPVAKRSSG